MIRRSERRYSWRFKRGATLDEWAGARIVGAEEYARDGNFSESMPEPVVEAIYENEKR